MKDYANTPTLAERMALGATTNATAHGAVIAVTPAQLRGASNSPDELEVLQAGGTVDTYVYHAEDGQAVMGVRRRQAPGEDKVFSQYRAGPSSATKPREWLRSPVAAPLPAYNLHLLAQRPAAPVLFVEGEKAAEAAAQQFPDYVATCWVGGSGGADRLDPRPFSGRRCVVWPDNDATGLATAHKLGKHLAAAGATVLLVFHELLRDYPESWDLADPVPHGLPGQRWPSELLLEAQPHQPPKPGRPAKAAASTRSSLNSAGASEEDRFYSALAAVVASGAKDMAQHNDWVWALLAARTLNPQGLDRFQQFCDEHGGDPDNAGKRATAWEQLEQRPNGQGVGPGSVFKAAKDASWEDPNPRGAGGKDTDPALLVRQQAEAAGDQYWVNHHNVAHATWVQTRAGATSTWHAPISSRAYTRLVQLRYMEALPGKMLTDEAMRRAVSLLEMMAENEAEETGTRHTTYQRSATGPDGSLYVDLGRPDWQCARVHPALPAPGWELVHNPPVRFVRSTSRTGVLPLPLPGGSRATWEAHVNAQRAHVTRVIAFAMACWLPLQVYPLLMVEGEAGSGKTTLLDALVRVVDPLQPEDGLPSLPNGRTNLAIHSMNVRVAAFNNVSDVTPDMADALCLLGEKLGVSRRKLHTDQDEARVNVRVPCGISSIGAITQRQDVQQRSMRVVAQVPAQRRALSAIQQAWQQDTPLLMGYLLTTISEAMRNLPTISAQLDAMGVQISRIGDLNLYVEAAHKSLGLELGEFTEELALEQKGAQADSAGTSQLGYAVQRWFSAGATWDAAAKRWLPVRKHLEGYAEEICGELREHAEDRFDVPASNKLKDSVARNLAGMRALGLQWQVFEVGTKPAGAQQKLRKTYYRVEVGPDFEALANVSPDRQGGLRVVQGGRG